MATIMPIASAVFMFFAALCLLPKRDQDTAVILKSKHEEGLRVAIPLFRALGNNWLSQWALRFNAWKNTVMALVLWLSGKASYISYEEASGALMAFVVGTTLFVLILSHSVLSIPVILMALFIGVELFNSKQQQQRKRQLAKEMPQVFRTLAVAMGSGQTLAQAVEYVGSHERGISAQAFSHAAMRLNCGDSTEDVLNDLGTSLDASGSELLSTALLISHRTGSPLRKLFLRSALLVERAGESERLLEVKTAQVRLSVRVVCILPLVLVGLLTLISPDFRDGLMTSVGAVSVGVAFLLDAVAVLIIRSLIRGVLK